MDIDLYDEFGNYIGPDLDDESVASPVSRQEEEHDEDVFQPADPTQLVVIDRNAPKNQIVLHEDKKYYPSAEEVYGPGVETIVQDEDNQLLTVPIIAPFKEEKTFLMEKRLPETTYKKEYIRLM